MKSVECICTTNLESSDDYLQQFKNIRKKCPVLRKIFVPDEIFDDFMSASSNFNATRHQPIVIGVLRNNCLARITVPAHIYLMENGDVSSRLTKQYKKDLMETWITKSEPIERHRKNRIFEGKLAELLCANYLGDRGWRINNLEALGGNHDIEALNNNEEPVAGEVKYIGLEDARFLEIEKSIATGNAVGGTIPIYDGYNFLILKICEAAYQLRHSEGKKIIFLIIGNVASSFIDFQVKNFLQVEQPKFSFSPQASNKWQEFFIGLQEQEKYREIGANTESIIGMCDSLWIIYENNYYEYSEPIVLNIRSTG